LAVAVSTEYRMVTKGGGNGTPSYKQVVVDNGKGAWGVGFKEMLTSTSRSGSEKNQESNQEKRDRVGGKPEKPRRLQRNQRTPVG
jgi:hypothetical protein